MIKKTVYTFIFFMSISLFSQKEKLNNYKYIIVPEKFDFAKSADQYQTSSLTKFLLKKQGFTAFLSNENFPNDLTSNRCLALTANVKEDSGLFNTKTFVEFTDCYKKVVYTTQIGKTKEKEYRRAYHESIRGAFKSLSDFTHSYTPDTKTKKIIEDVVEDQKIKKDAVKVATPPKVVATPVIKKEIKKEVKKQKPVISNNSDVLYAQPKNNGFQLINTKPEVVFVVLKTNTKNLFIIKGKNGILHKVGEKWVAEYYVNQQFITKEYQIKF